MIRATHETPKPENPIRAMWLGVIYQILADLRNSKTKPRSEAELYINNESLGLPILCAVTGISYAKVLLKAAEIKADVVVNGYAKRGRRRKGEDWLQDEDENAS